MKYRICLHPVSILFSILFSCILLPEQLEAKRFSIIRDAEIEYSIRSFARPLLEAAGLEPLSLKIHIINDQNLNAFVAGGQQIFINSGLILRSENADQLIGVLAHEIGHISGGHLIKSTTARKNMDAASFLGILLGGAAVIAGKPGVGSAAIQFGQDVSLKNYFYFSRTQEAENSRRSGITE